METKETNSGIFIRNEREFGLMAYSPHTGLMYAVHPSDSDIVTKWLENPTSIAPSEIYKSSLGTGWTSPLDYSNYDRSHLLPDEKSWSTVPSVRNPILINWLITGRCPLACKYCYAEDLMRKDDEEPDKAQIQRIAASILKLKPLVVVLTGGDPLFSPHLEDAMKYLSGKSGIIVDTSGYTFRPTHIKLFKEFKIAVRISLDSERPRENQRNRILYPEYEKITKIKKSTAEAALDALSQCLDAGIAVTVQTVATRWNANDLVSFGDKLYRLGVHSWRIFKVADSKTRHAEYENLLIRNTSHGKKNDRGPYEHAFENVLEAHQNRWKQSMAVQVTYNSSPNAVVLVSPNGKFYTESNVMLGKVLLDDLHPNQPSVSALNRKVDMRGHVDRYFNRTGPILENE